MANRTQLQTALQKNYDRVLFGKEVLNPVFGSAFSLSTTAVPASVQPNKTEQSVIDKVAIYGNINLEDRTEITCYEIVLQPTVQIEKSKVAIQQYVRKLLTAGQIALVNFIAPQNKNVWRLTLVAKDSEITDKGIKEKTTNAKRYTYLLGSSQSCFTVAQRLEELSNKSAKGIKFKDLIDAFSVSTLTKEFYNELFKWYEWTFSEEVGVTFPKNTASELDNREKLEEQIIRLITRLLFVWFIKQKHLVPNNLFDKEELKKILKDFDPNDRKSGNYYNAILQNLFFATLNKAVTERAFATEPNTRDIKTLYRYAEMFSINEKDVLKLFSEIPFLNGGLFECLDKETSTDGVKYHLDGFSRNDRKVKGQFSHRAYIPNCVFFDEERGIIPLLERYNFTVEENAPEDVQVALDPELLGNVFENLLGAYNSETKESARKQSGSFYTPREIVDFMVSESLIAYLQNDFENQSDNIRALFENEELPEALKKDKKLRADIFKKLREVKIIDPACGSGAFPMGILNKMVQVLEKLDIENKHDIYDLKLHLIQECIYGVDLQTIAAQISKLRFFISLIVEQHEMDLSKPKENYNVETLPNLETKFVAANTLISIGSGNRNLLDLKDEKLSEMKNELWKIREEHFYAKGTTEKKKLRLKDEKLREEIKNYIQQNASKPDEKIIATFKNEIAKLEKERKNYEGVNMVDVTEKTVQTDMFGTPSKKQASIFSKDINKEKRDSIDKQIKGLQANIDKENNKGKQVGFEAEVEKLAKWNPYDQNSSSTFFDTEWMFGVKTGFDVVIGNPPYVQLQKENGRLAKMFEKAGYKTFERTGDIYSLFYEKGTELLKPQGHLCFITSNKWMRAGYGESTRKFFAENTNPVLLIDFAGQKIFETATVDVNILMFSKDKNQQKTLACIVKVKVLSNLSVFVRQAGAECSFATKESWTILSPIEQSIKKKIEKVGTPLKDWDINIYRGILTGYNEAFIIDGTTKDKLIKEDAKSAEVIRPILRGRDIKRYGYEYADLYLLFIPWHFPLHTDPTITGSSDKAEKAFKAQYPAVYKHLLSHKKELENRNKAETGIRYEWYALQRWGANYWDDFFKQKIMYPNMTKYLPFYLDDKGFMQNDKSFMITGKNIAFLTAFLNSSVFKYCFIDNFPELQGGTRELRKIFLDKIPVLEVSEKANKEFEKLVLKLQDFIAKGKPTKELEVEIDEMIFDLYALTKDERKIIGFIEIQ